MAGRTAYMACLLALAGGASPSAAQDDGGNDAPDAAVSANDADTPLDDSAAATGTPVSGEEAVPPDETELSPEEELSAAMAATAGASGVKEWKPAKAGELDENGRIPTAAFAGMSAFIDASISPDGSRFAFISLREGKVVIVIADAVTREMITSIDVGSVANFGWYRWAGDDRILFSNTRRVFAFFYFFPETKLRVFDISSGKTHLVGFEEQGLEGDDVLYVDRAGDYVILSLNRKLGEEPDVYRFPLDGTGEDGAVMVQKSIKGIDEWWADSAGTVRLGMRFLGRTRANFYYRSSSEEEFRRVARIRRDTKEEVDSWDVIGLRPGSDIGYAVVENAAGRRILTEFDFSTGETGAVVYENPDWDVDSVSIAHDGRALGASYTDDEYKTHWLDPGLAKTEKQLRAALGDGAISIQSHSDSGRLLVRHGSAADPGVLYIFRPETKQLDTIAELRPDLDWKQLAGPSAISYTARDGTPIRGYLTLPRGREPKNLPLIILPHGGPYGVRDSLRYDDEVQFLASRGYAVLQPNYRGSGGYGLEFAQLGDGQIGRKMQDDLDDAMDWAVAQGIADPERVCLVGGSYGGFAAMWGVLRNPERYRCAASWAGVTDFEEQLKYDKDTLFRRAARRWKDRVEGNERGFDLDDVSPAHQARRLVRPLLLAHGTADDTVPYDQYRRMKVALEKAEKNFETLVIEDEGHSFSKAESEQAWYDALEAFLAKHNPAD